MGDHAVEVARTHDVVESTYDSGKGNMSNEAIGLWFVVLLILLAVYLARVYS